jgi:hypothetical protein
MTKRLVAVTGEYISKKDNTQKAEYTEIGVILIGKNGKEYALLDPAINLAGVLLKQNALAAKRNEPPSDKVMLSVFEDAAQNQQAPQQAPQQPNAHYGNQAPQQGNYNQAPHGYPQQNYNQPPR